MALCFSVCVSIILYVDLVVLLVLKSTVGHLMFAKRKFTEKLIGRRRAVQLLHSSPRQWRMNWKQEMMLWQTNGKFWTSCPSITTQKSLNMPFHLFSRGPHFGDRDWLNPDFEESYQRGIVSILMDLRRTFVELGNESRLQKPSEPEDSVGKWHW